MSRIPITVLMLAVCTLETLWTESPPTLSYREQALYLGDKTYRVRVPAGYTLEVLSTELLQPRLLAFGPDEELFIGSRSGRVYRLRPPYYHPEVLVELDDYPHSVALCVFCSKVATDSTAKLPPIPDESGH